MTSQLMTCDDALKHINEVIDDALTEVSHTTVTSSSRMVDHLLDLSLAVATLSSLIKSN